MKDKFLALLKQKKHEHETVSGLYVYNNVDLIALAEALAALAEAELAKRMKPNVDWAGLDPNKWGETEYTTSVSQKGHWEEDDIGKIWVDEEE